MFINFQKRILKAVKKVDIFAQPVQLLIKQEDGHKTLFGAFLTLALISFFLYMLFINLVTMMEKSNPSSFSNEFFHSSPEYFKLVPQNFTLTFAFQTPNFATYIDESIYIVEASMVKKETKIIDGKKQDEWISQTLPIKACSAQLIQQNELIDYFTHLDLPTNYCIDWDQINQVDLQGTFDTDIFSHILIQFKMCNESTKKSKECKTRSEIKQSLEQNYFSLQMSSYVIDIKNNTSLNPKGDDFFTTISSKIFKEISFYLQPITIFTDLGYITQEFFEEKTLRFKRNTEMIDLNESDLIMNVVLRLDQIEQQYYRSYMKLQTILSQMGGLWQVFFTAAFLITKPINLLSYYVRILNSLFQFEQNNNRLKQNEKNSKKEINDNDECQVEALSPRNGSENDECLNQKKVRAGLILKSIYLKRKQIEILDKQQETDPGIKEQAKQKLSKAISSSIKNYFHNISKKIIMRWTYYLYFLNCFVSSKNVKSLQIEYSVKKIYKQLDVLYIMKKLQEIDKLKMILLTESQINLFDYIQKPTIPIDPSQNQFNTNQQYFSILRPIKTDYQRAIDAQNAFHEIADNFDNPINVKLINSIDKKIINLLRMRKDTEMKSIESECISEQPIEINQILCFNIPRNHKSVDI